MRHKENIEKNNNVFVIVLIKIGCSSANLKKAEPAINPNRIQKYSIDADTLNAAMAIYAFFEKFIIHSFLNIF